MKGWDYILKNISETVGCNLSSEGRMKLGSGKQICLLRVLMTNQKTLRWREHGALGMGGTQKAKSRWYKGRWEELGGSRSHGVFYPTLRTNFLM